MLGIAGLTGWMTPPVATATPLPDLTMIAVSAPLNGAVGQPLQIVTTVRNNGTAPAPAFGVRLWMSSSDPTPGAGRLVGTRSVSGLAAATSATATTVVTVPADLPVGSYYVSAVADGAGVITELNEANNGLTAAGRVSIALGLPNLSMLAVSGPASALTTKKISVSSTVKNVGAEAAGAFRIRFYMSPSDGTPAAGTSVGVRDVAGLAPGASSAASTLVTIPAGFANGNYFLSAFADPDKVLTEVSRSNNGHTAAVRIAVTQFRPDLVVTEVVPGADVVTAGGSLVVTATVKNRGPLAAGPFTVGFKLGTDVATAAGAGLPLGTWSVASLAAGVSVRGTTTLTVPGGLAAGLYFVGVLADTDDALVEGVETNNALASGRPVRVLPAGGGSGRYRVGGRGLYTQFERRGWASEWWSGQVVQQLENFDGVVGHTVADEVALQLDTMRGMGVNAISFELRAADTDGNFTWPTCHLHPVLGLQWPQPTPSELTNLVALFDLFQSKGIRVYLRLVNTHMEENPPTNNQTWLDAILGALKGHPALDLVMFEGDTHGVDGSGDGVPDACGIPAEPPLWLGAAAKPAQYVKWAIGHAMSLGYPARLLSAEAIIGSFFVESQPPAGPDAQDHHLWSPIGVLKHIFDDLVVPDAQRTYAVSFYEHRKCSDAGSLACTEMAPHQWAEQTLQALFATIGTGNGARVVAGEMGASVPVDSTWPTARALESLVALMEKYGVEGGAFWRWVSFDNNEDANPTLAEPVKRRGVAFVYTPVQKEVLDLGGLHLVAIPNGSFEIDANANNVPDDWGIAGTGTGSRYLLTVEPGQPEVPSRGSYALRLVTGPGANDAVLARSAVIPVAPSTEYTTTANLRFGWTGDPTPSGAPTTRPRVFVRFRYFTAGGTASAIHASDEFRFFQEDATTGFDTFPLRYTTPADAASARIEIGAVRAGLPTPITLDADNLR